MSMYGITYNDMSYMTVELTDDEYQAVSKGLMDGARGISMEGTGVLLLKDVRSVLKQIPLPEENPSYTPDLSEEEQEHIAMVQWAEKMAAGEEDETEYTGGMMP